MFSNFQELSLQLLILIQTNFVVIGLAQLSVKAFRHSWTCVKESVRLHSILMVDSKVNFDFLCQKIYDNWIYILIPDV
jgi:hypothetical protein